MTVPASGSDRGSVQGRAAWLYFAVSTVQDPAGYWSSQRGLFIHDRPRDVSTWTLDDLRAGGIASTAPDVDRLTADVAVFARPWGRTPSLRSNPDHPVNRADLAACLQRWGRRALRTPSEGLWFIPGWVVDAWVAPRFVELPGDEPVHTNTLSAFAGPVFRHGLTAYTRDRGAVGTLEAWEEQLLVFDIAGPAYAPAVVRPGVVLDARVVVHGSHAGQTVHDEPATAALRRTYLGAVVRRVPAQSGRVLPGEPMQDVCAGAARQIRRALGSLLLDDEVVEERSRAPGFGA